MDMKFIIEPEYQNSFWCTETIKGMRSQAYHLKISLTPAKQEMLPHLPQNCGSTVVVVIGTSINWLNSITPFLLDRGYLCLLVTGDYDYTMNGKTSSLLLNYRSSTKALLAHLYQAGDRKIAFFGVNPNSYSDRIKSKSFHESDIYYNYGSITTCTNQFFYKLEQYDAAICANDVVAIYLLRYLSEKGIRIPDKFHLASFGGLFLAQLIDPPITTISQDYRLLGQQAVKVCSFLKKNPQLVINALINCPIKIQRSSEISHSSASDIIPLKQAVSSNCKPYASTVSGKQTVGKEVPPDVNFYDDLPVLSLMALERLISESDQLDIQILLELFDGNTLEKTAEYLNLSLSALRYRIRKMASFFPSDTRENMMETVKQYLNKASLENALQKK